MYNSAYQLEADLKKKVVAKPDDSHRTTTKTLCCVLENGEHKFVEWGQGDYAGFLRAYNRNKLLFMHEFLRHYRRARGDSDLDGWKLEEFKKYGWTVEQLMQKFEACILRTIRLYYKKETYGNPLVRWLDGTYPEKVSLHFITKNFVFQDREPQREIDLARFYALLEYEMSKSEEFKGTNISIFLDKSIVNKTMFRMPNALKQGKPTPMRPVKDLELHELLVCMWRREDKDEFFRIAQLNELGESLFNVPEAIEMGQMINFPTRIKRAIKEVQQLEVKSLLEFAEEFKDFEAKEEDDYGIRLERIRSGFCDQCKRVHDRDHAKVRQWEGMAYYSCFRATEKDNKQVLLGRVSLEDTRKRCNKKERIYQAEVKTIMPFPRPFELRIREPNLTNFLERCIQLLIINKYLLLRSALDTGKTALLIQLLLRFGWNRVVIPTVRTKFAESLAERLRSMGLNVRIYSQEDGKLGGNGIFIIQVESLRRFEEDKCILIMDEMESILHQISNDTTMDPVRKTETWNKLILLVKNCEYMLGLDAHISQRSVDFVHNIIGRQPVVVDNTFKHGERQVLELETFDIFCESMSNLAKNKRRLFIWMASKEKAGELLRKLAKIVGRNKILFIHDGVAIGDVDIEWIKYDIVIVTPAITLGVSFNVANHFHHVCAYVSPYSCKPRDCVQAFGRVRHPISGTVYMHMCTTAYHSKLYEPDTIKNIEQFLRNHGKQAEDSAKESDCHIKKIANIHPAVFRTTVLNMLEDILGKRCFRSILEWYLKFSGFVIGPKLDESIQEDVNTLQLLPPLAENDMRLVEGDTTMSYAEITPVLDDMVGRRLMSLVRNGTATRMQRCQANVWCFHHVIIPAPLAEKLYDEYWPNKKKKSWLNSLRAEKMTRGRMVEQYSDHNMGAESIFASVSLDRLSVIRDLCTRLGVENTGTSCVILRSTLERIVLSNDLENRMGVTRSAATKQDANAKARRLSVIFSDWSGATLKRLDRSRRRIDGVDVETGDFKLEALEEGNVWNVLNCVD